MKIKNSIFVMSFALVLLLTLSSCGKSETENNDVPVSTQTSSDSGVSIESNLAVPSVTGRLHVSGSKLVDKDGGLVQLRGVSTHNIAWFPQYINPELFSEFKNEWKANVIRLSLYTAEFNGYCNGGDKEELKTIVKNGVQYATDNDMFVIIDWHTLTDNNPNINKDEAIKFFDEMSKEFANNNNVFYEICNEPSGDTTWSDIKSYSEEVISVIRQNDPEGIIIVGTPEGSHAVNNASADPITTSENIMYSLHFHASEDKDELRNTMAGAVNQNLPIFATEFGICEHHGDGKINEEEANKWISDLNDYNISYIAWNASNKDETSAFFSSNVTKTSGFTSDDLSVAGQWVYDLLNSAAQKKPDTDAVASVSVKTIKIPDSMKNVTMGTISADVELVNVWQQGGETYYKYNATIKNLSPEPCKTWSIALGFDNNITLHDNWNGTFSVEGKTLHISNDEFNGSIQPVETVTDVGFIVSGGTFVK